MEKVKAFADWLTKWFTVIVIVWAVFNYFVPAASLWGKAYTGYMLGIVLFGMGLTLTLDDFKRILTQPLMVIVGTVAHFIGNEFVKMIFVSFLNSNIYPLKNLLTSRVCIALETPYSKASSHFPIASHLQ